MVVDDEAYNNYFKYNNILIRFNQDGAELIFSTHGIGTDLLDFADNG